MATEAHKTGKSLTSLSEFALEQISTHREFIRAFSKNEILGDIEKLNVLMKMRFELAKEINGLLVEPEKPKILFKKRKNKQITAIEFTKLNFSKSLGLTLTPSHIRKFDSYLYDCLMREKRKNGGVWPKDFALMTKEEIINRDLNSLTTLEKEKIEKTGLNIRARRIKRVNK